VAGGFFETAIGFGEADDEFTGGQRFDPDGMGEGEGNGSGEDGEDAKEGVHGSGGGRWVSGSRDPGEHGAGGKEFEVGSLAFAVFTAEDDDLGKSRR